jgi:hypothetical protein
MNCQTYCCSGYQFAYYREVKHRFEQGNSKNQSKKEVNPRSQTEVAIKKVKKKLHFYLLDQWKLLDCVDADFTNQHQ